MAAPTLRFIDKLLIDPPQFHLLPSAANSSSRLLPTSNVACIPDTKQLRPHPRPLSTSNVACTPRAGTRSPTCTARGEGVEGGGSEALVELA